MDGRSVQELMRIVDGGVKTTYPTEIRYRTVKPHWWSKKTIQQPYEFTPEPEYYNGEDALEAVRLLGESGSAEALAFLENIYLHPSIDCKYEEYEVSGGSEPRDDDMKYIIRSYVVYSRVYGDFRGWLTYFVGSDDGYCDDAELNMPDYDEMLQNGELPPPGNRRAHLAMRTAIAKLKESLGS
jgi:hypothetical protein